MTMIHRIKIELLSDLCSESGTTKGRSVDNDICVDESGFPYIPGKRIKGVLLQGYLDYLDITGKEDDSEEIFGEEDGKESGLYLSDAMLDRKPGSIPDDYIYERTQTKVDSKTGIAADGSLRTSAVAKQGSVFYFTLESKLDKNELEEFLPLIQYIGANRNRGLGHVRFSIEEKKENETAEKLHLSALDDNKEYQYDIVIQATSNILLPQENENVTGDVIPGSSLYGFFAYRYIHENHLDDPMSDEDFVNIFYHNGITFSYGYISDDKGSEYYPLPSCIQKAKNLNKYQLYLSLTKEKEEGDGVKFKPLSNKYGHFDNKDLKIQGINHSFDYHHRRDKANMGKGLVDSDNFFQYESLSKGQYFRFSLTGQGRYLKKLLNDLSIIHIGRSRTAQYGSAAVIPSLCSFKEKNAYSKCANSQYYLAIATSPILLKPEYDSEIGNPDYASMLKAIQTKEPSLEPFTLNDEIRCYHLSKQLISGFNMHWKKAKPSQYAIASGSYILLKSSQNTPIDQMIQIGQKKNEGFGVIHFIPFEKSCELKLDEPSEKNEIGNEVITSPIFLALKQKELAIDYFNDHKNNLIQMNHALLGRMIMMLKDTQDRGYDAFKNRLSDIKDEKKMKDALDLLKECEKEGFDKGRNYFHFFYTLLTQIKYAQRKGE